MAAKPVAPAPIANHSMRGEIGVFLRWLVTGKFR
jgi:hypothetical protein